MFGMPSFVNVRAGAIPSVGCDITIIQWGNSFSPRPFLPSGRDRKLRPSSVRRWFRLHRSRLAISAAALGSRIVTYLPGSSVFVPTEVSAFREARSASPAQSSSSSFAAASEAHPLPRPSGVRTVVLAMLRVHRSYPKAPFLVPTEAMARRFSTNPAAIRPALAAAPVIFDAPCTLASVWTASL